MSGDVLGTRRLLELIQCQSLANRIRGFAFSTNCML